MKQLKKVLLTIACLCVIFGTIACGNTGGSGDTTTNDRNNDVTEGTDRNNNNDGGLMDDVGNAVGDGIEDVGDGVKNITDDATGNNR